MFTSRLSYAKAITTELGNSVLQLALLPTILFCGAISAFAEDSDARPNVLFIAVDDLNDWIEPLAGHPQAKTPQLSRLARESVLFTHCYCASPACNPSRSALLTGIHTYNSGMYSNYQDWRKVMPNAKTIGEYFREHGYWTGGAGKIFHYDQVSPASWNEYFPSQQWNMPRYFYPKPGETVNMPKFENMYMDFDWSPIDLPDEETGDYKCVHWVSQKLQGKFNQPFFLACGIYRPHLPWYVPQKYFDMFPIDSISLPLLLAEDGEDLGIRAKEIITRGGNYHKHVVESGNWKKAVQGYLASIAFADAMVGRLLDALASSPYAKNTIVVLWSDHGWQLGEKQHWHKFALWENVLRCVMIIKVPEGVSRLPSGSRPGSRCDRITSLMDIYPTLVDLCGLPPRDKLDGHSLTPLLADPSCEWNYPAITTNEFLEFSVRTENWRYIRYVDGSEELYDHRNDPEEWHNLAGDVKHSSVIEKLAQVIPPNPAPLREETIIELLPHHARPFTSKEEYFRTRKLLP